MRFKGLIDGKWEYVLLPYSYYEKHYIQTKSRIGVHKETKVQFSEPAMNGVIK